MSDPLTPEQLIQCRHLMGFINVTAASRDFDPFSSDSEKLTRIANAIAILSDCLEPPISAEEALDAQTLDQIQVLIDHDKRGKLRACNGGLD